MRPLLPGVFPTADAEPSSVPGSGTSTGTAGWTWCRGPTVAIRRAFTYSCGGRMGPSRAVKQSSSSCPITVAVRSPCAAGRAPTCWTGTATGIPTW
jgi:hypothetical protein